MIGRPPVPLKVRFWRFVTPGDPDECWEWRGGLDKDGYGSIESKGKTLRAHRVSFEMHHHPLTDGELVCHSCDHPPCVNPAHLFAGSISDNIADMVAKGRATRKLTDDQIVAIICDPRSPVEIAGYFSIHRASVSKIKRGESRRHVWGLVA